MINLDMMVMVEVVFVLEQTTPPSIKLFLAYTDIMEGVGHLSVIV